MDLPVKTKTSSKSVLSKEQGYRRNREPVLNFLRSLCQSFCLIQSVFHNVWSSLSSSTLIFLSDAWKPFVFFSLGFFGLLRKCVDSCLLGSTKNTYVCGGEYQEIRDEFCLGSPTTQLVLVHCFFLCSIAVKVKAASTVDDELHNLRPRIGKKELQTKTVYQVLQVKNQQFVFPITPLISWETRNFLDALK